MRGFFFSAESTEMVERNTNDMIKIHGNNECFIAPPVIVASLVMA
jgi:hypothetical protein